VLDTGAPGSEEEERARSAVARLGPLGESIALHQGSFAAIASLIGSSKLYVGYDSAGQHAAAAAGVPMVSVFGGFSCERMLQRWTPDAFQPARVIAVRGQSFEQLIEETRMAIGDLGRRG
jgi:ADP-heptose:LPS heptosyltransferase